MVTDLRKGIWSELATRQSIDMYRRNLQKAFVERLINNLTPDNYATTAALPTQGRGGGTQTSDYSKTTDAISVAKAQLRALQAEIKAALPTYKDVQSRAHLQDVSDRITEVLNPKA
jgi:hypothetical protein